MEPVSLDPVELCAAFSQAKNAEKPALLLTGPIGSGKTQAASLLAKILPEKGFSVAGIVCPRILKDGETLGYIVRDIRTGRSLPLCAISPHELLLLVKTTSPSSEPSPPEGEKGESALFPNSSCPQEGEGLDRFFQVPPRKGDKATGKTREKTYFSSDPSGVAPLGGDRFFSLLGGNSLSIPSPPGGEGQGEGDIFRFRRFFFSQRTLDFGNSVLMEAAGKAEVIVVDEVGPLELSGRGFAPGLRACRESKAFLILTVRPHLIASVKRWLNLKRAEVFSLRGKGEE